MFKQPTPHPSPKDIKRLETHIGHALPTDYRTFLLRQDGGRLASNNHAVKQVFGCSSDSPDWANIWFKLEIFAGRVPDWLLPVAQDEYGNLFALSLRQQDFGTVWFWDHEQEADEGEPPSEENIRLQAPGWNDFLQSLRAVTP